MIKTIQTNTNPNRYATIDTNDIIVLETPYVSTGISYISTCLKFVIQLKYNVTLDVVRHAYIHSYYDGSGKYYIEEPGAGSKEVVRVPLEHSIIHEEVYNIYNDLLKEISFKSN